MLRESLVAAQAATFTARASAAPSAPATSREVLARIFGGEATNRLGGSFAAALPQAEQER